MAATRKNGWVKFAAAGDVLADVYGDDNLDKTFKGMIVVPGTANGVFGLNTEDGTPAAFGNIRTIQNGSSIFIPGPLSFPRGFEMDSTPTAGEIYLIE